MYIHLVGVGGIAMGTLACMLRDEGHRVTGSDEGIYPPMSDILRDHGIDTFQGYSSSNLRSPDLVIIGNALSRGNVEVEAVLDDHMSYMSMAGALFEFFLRHREVINVSGTHGTTSIRQPEAPRSSHRAVTESGAPKANAWYVFTDSWKAGVTAVAFWGPSQSLFGRYSKNDQIEAEVIFSW